MKLLRGFLHSLKTSISFVGWTGLARVVRGRLISLREEDYVMAAKISNASNFTIIKRHLITL